LSEKTPRKKKKKKTRKLALLSVKKKENKRHKASGQRPEKGKRGVCGHHKEEKEGEMVSLEKKPAKLVKKREGGIVES